MRDTRDNGAALALLADTAGLHIHATDCQDALPNSQRVQGDTAEMAT